MPSTTSSTVSADFDSSTVMTPSLPTFSIASAIRLPIVLSLFEAIVATWAISFLSLVDFESFFSSSVTASTAASMPRLSPIGLAPAVTLLEALAEDRLGQHGRGGGAVTRDVGGLGGDLLQHLGAHVLVRVLQLDLLGDGDAVLGDRRAAELLVDDDVAALRAQRRLHGLRP